MHTWIIIGDFNAVRWLVDRTGDMRGLNLMCSFNDTITELEVEEVQLGNRYFTWSGSRLTPMLFKLDRCFISKE